MTERFHDHEPNSPFEFDLNGAFLTDLSDSQGRPILFTRTTIGEKTRGGSHVCLPNFGPDSSGELAQHGFGRTSRWDLIADESTEDGIRAVELSLDTSEVPQSYRDIQARLKYWHGPDHFSMRLTVLNGGESAMRVAPGFHPYFVADQPVRLNGEPIDLSAYSGTEYIDGSQHVLELGDRKLVLSSQNLSRWALWTDQMGDYFCVEPTLAGPSFDQKSITQSEMIGPGRLKSYDLTIAWS